MEEQSPLTCVLSRCPHHPSDWSLHPYQQQVSTRGEGGRTERGALYPIHIQDADSGCGGGGGLLRGGCPRVRLRARLGAEQQVGQGYEMCLVDGLNRFDWG